MRFEGTSRVDGATETIWRALRDPATLERIIPNCTRIEMQPADASKAEQDYTLGFEIGAPDMATGAEPIIGWLNATRHLFGHALRFSMTLSDGVLLVKVEGSAHLSGRDHDQWTELRYEAEASLPEMDHAVWSEAAIAEAEAVIAKLLTRLATVAAPVPTSVGGADRDQPEVLADSARGRVVRVPAPPAAPTMAMLRRMALAEERHQRDRVSVVASVILVASALTGIILAVTQLLRERARG